MPEVVIYMSDVSGNIQAKKDTQSLVMLLKAKKIPYKQVDISIDEEAKKFMWSKSSQKALPQVFVDGKFKAMYDELSDANEAGELESFLGI